MVKYNYVVELENNFGTKYRAEVVAEMYSEACLRALNLHHLAGFDVKEIKIKRGGKVL